MAVTNIAGAETRQAQAESVSLSGTASISTAQARTGTASYRCNPASGAYGSVGAVNSGGYIHFGLRIASLPSVTRILAGVPGAFNQLRLTSTGTIEYFDGASVIGTSAALSLDTWYWIGYVSEVSITGPLLAIGGTTAVTGTSGLTASGDIGFSGTEASAVDAYFDDIVRDDAALLAPSKVVLLVPISDNSRTNWTAGAGGTTNLWDAVDNKPPVGVASASETDTTNIESASNTGTANYIANLTTYTTAGIVAGDTVLAIRLIVQTGEDISTGTKTGSFESTGNPVIASTTISSFGTGAHGTSPTTWNFSGSAVSSLPAVTLGSSLTMKVIKTNTGTRTACIDFMGALVAYTPAVASLPKRGTFVRQAVTRAAVR